MKTFKAKTFASKTFAPRTFSDSIPVPVPWAAGGGVGGGSGGYVGYGLMASFKDPSAFASIRANVPVAFAREPPRATPEEVEAIRYRRRVAGFEPYRRRGADMLREDVERLRERRDRGDGRVE